MKWRVSIVLFFILMVPQTQASNCIDDLLRLDLSGIYTVNRPHTNQGFTGNRDIDHLSEERKRKEFSIGGTFFTKDPWSTPSYFVGVDHINTLKGKPVYNIQTTAPVLQADVNGNHEIIVPRYWSPGVHFGVRYNHFAIAESNKKLVMVFFDMTKGMPDLIKTKKDGSRDFENLDQKVFYIDGWSENPIEIKLKPCRLGSCKLDDYMEIRKFQVGDGAIFRGRGHHQEIEESVELLSQTQHESPGEELQEFIGAIDFKRIGGFLAREILMSHDMGDLYVKVKISILLERLMTAQEIREKFGGYSDLQAALGSEQVNQWTNHEVMPENFMEVVIEAPLKDLPQLTNSQGVRIISEYFSPASKLWNLR